MSQLERVIYINEQITINKGVTIKDVAKKFEVSERTVHRDIEYLKNRLNAPMASKRGRYYYTEKFTCIDNLNQETILSYAILKSILQNENYVPCNTNEILKSLEKILSQKKRDFCQKIIFNMPQYNQIDSTYFMLICIAFETRKCLNLEYENLQNEKSKRKIEPERLINYNGAWYLVCWDYKSSNLRTFHLSRIQNITILKEPYENHDDKYPTEEYESYEQHLDRFINSSFGIFCGNKSETVKIRFFKEALRIVRYQKWHKDQKMTVLNNNNEEIIELEVPVSNYTEILSKVLSFGSNAVPIYPKKFCDLWESEVKRMFENMKMF